VISVRKKVGHDADRPVLTELTDENGEESEHVVLKMFYLAVELVEVPDNVAHLIDLVLSVGHDLRR